MLAISVVLSVTALAAGGDFDEAELQQLAAGLESTGDERSLRKIVDEMLPRVARVMRTSPPRNFELRIVSRDEAASKLQAVLRREYPGDAMERLGIALQTVHLVEPGTDLAKEAAALYGKNVSGFYDAKDRALYLIRDQPMMAQVMIIPHELAHAVQDAQMGLDRAMNNRRQSEDATMALSAALEGNAQAVASAVLADAAQNDEGAGMLSALSESVGESAETAALQSDASPWLGLQLRFPYGQGLKLVQAARAKGDAQGMQVLSRPPESTAQVIDPALYFRQEHPRTPKPMGLAMALFANKVVYETTLGRANLDLFGDLHANGAELGEGWRGDRLEVVKLKTGVAAVWSIAFSNAAQATRFVAAYRKLIDGLGDSVRAQDTRVVVVEGVPKDLQPVAEAAGLHAFE